MSRVDGDALLKISSRLGDAVVNPAVWPQILDEISRAAGAVGAALLQSDVRTSDIPRTEGVIDLFKAYFAEEWHARDIRADRGVPLMLRGQKVVVTDQDIITREEMHRCSYYQDLLAPHGLTWWAAVGFRAGSALWGLTLHRSSQQGPFEAHDARALAQISVRLTDTATLSTMVGRAALSGVTNALQLMMRPALALDHLGFALDFNSAAEQLFSQDFRVRNRHLEFGDPQAKSDFDAFIQRLRTTPGSVALSVAPIVLRRASGWPLILRILPIDGPARSPFLGARALIVFSDLHRASDLRPSLLSQAFGLSPAEAKLAATIAKGISMEEAAQELGISLATARSQLKVVFAKTSTHRQSELVAMLSRI